MEEKEQVKSKYLWRFEAEGFPVFAVCSVRRPQLSAVSEYVVQKTIHLEVHNVVSPSTAHTVWEWFYSGKSVDASVVLLDPMDCDQKRIIEQWNYKKVNLVFVDFGSLSYDSYNTEDDNCTIRLIMNYDFVELVPPLNV